MQHSTPVDVGGQAHVDPVVRGVRRRPPPPPAQMAARGGGMSPSDASAALSAAMRAGDVRGMQAALDAGADLWSSRGTGDLLPLVEAAWLRQPAAVAFLLARGAHVNADCCGGLTAMMVAAIHGDVAIIEALAQTGADVTLAKDDGWTALHLAVKGGHVAAAQALMALGALPGAKTSGGDTCVDVALYKSSMVRLRHSACRLSAVDPPLPLAFPPVQTAPQKDEMVRLLRSTVTLRTDIVRAEVPRVRQEELARLTAEVASLRASLADAEKRAKAGQEAAQHQVGETLGEGGGGGGGRELAWSLTRPSAHPHWSGAENAGEGSAGGLPERCDRCGTGSGGRTLGGSGSASGGTCGTRGGDGCGGACGCAGSCAGRVTCPDGGHQAGGSGVEGPARQR
jgi:hypothetical protein